jgi:hypothetical protein
VAQEAFRIAAHAAVARHAGAPPDFQAIPASATNNLKFTLGKSRMNVLDATATNECSEALPSRE